MICAKRVRRREQPMQVGATRCTASLLPRPLPAFLPSAFLLGSHFQTSPSCSRHMLWPGPWDTSLFPMGSRLLTGWGVLSHLPLHNGRGAKGKPTHCHVSGVPRNGGRDPQPLALVHRPCPSSELHSPSQRGRRMVFMLMLI